MTAETAVHLRLDSASVFAALRDQVGEWVLSRHEFDPRSDEVAVSYDISGSGRVSLTVTFELDREGMARLLREARPAADHAG
jgi:hypothetical protein